MKNSKYWENAALLREIAVQEGATATAEDILKLYDEALYDINSEMQKIKRNFTRRFGLDNETATYFLEAAQEEENLQMLINALEAAPTEKAREDILTYIHLDGLSVRAYAARTERYEAVKKSIYARIKKLAADETKLMTDMLKNAYKESYYGLIDDAAKGLNVGINFALLDDDAIEAAISTKWHGSRFSERIWKNTDRLAEEAQNLVTKALMSGESLTKTATKLADSFDVEKYHATTLVRTETAHAHAMADLKGYEDLGIKEYKYLATLDYLTCTRCQPLDGMVFKVSEAREGVNYPTLHPRCRCTTTMNMEYTSRRARDPETGRNITIDGNTTYSEWVKNMTPEQRQALDLAKRKNEHRTSDKLQHEKYRKALGTKQVPRGFKEFQELKYKNPEKWLDLKELYKNNTIKVNEARASDLFYVIPPFKGDAIKAQSIFKELNKSEVGKMALEFIQNQKPKIEINYTDECPNLYGRTWGNNIEIFAKNTRTVLKTSQTIIHEVTHMKNNIGGTQWAEAVCFLQEKKHIKKELTFSEKKDIIKEVKMLYSDFTWR